MLHSLIFSVVLRKGDYHRYLAEFLTGEKRKEAGNNSHESYKTASDIAAEGLQPTHPIRLGNETS